MKKTLILVGLIILSACQAKAPEVTEIVNFRDLGGLTVKDGRTVKQGLLLRGAALCNLTQNDSLALVKRYALAKIYDFRFSFEADAKPDKAVGCAEYLSIPAMSVESFPKPKQHYNGIEDLVIHCAKEPWFQETVHQMYFSLAFSDYSREAYRSFMKDLAGTGDGAAYWHCSQGKDRTGFAAAMVLYALGASKEVIINDFAKSNERYATDIERVRGIVKADGGDEAALETVDAMIGCSVVNFSAVLDSIDRRFGSADSYLEEWLGVGPKEKEILQKRYLN